MVSWAIFGKCPKALAGMLDPVSEHMAGESSCCGSAETGNVTPNFWNLGGS